MRRIGKRKQGDIEPDLTSFSDIANLLIIFFILTTTLTRPWGRRVDMPGASAPPQQQTAAQSATPTVNLTKDRITFSTGGGRDKEVSMGELRRALLQQNFPSKDEKSRSVAIETSPDVPYERYYQVVTAIAAAGGVVAILTD